MACSHTEKIRVFEMGERAIKIFVGSYTLNRLSVLTDTGRENFLLKKENSLCMQYCILQAHHIEQLVMYLMDEVKAIAENTKNSKFDRMIRDPKSSFINARKSIIGGSNLKLSQAQCIDMILPELIEELTKINTVSPLLLNHKKVTKFLECEKISHVILNLLKKSYIILT